MDGMGDLNAPVSPMGALSATDGLDDMGGDQDLANMDMGADQDMGMDNGAQEGGSPKIEDFKNNFDNADPGVQDATINFFDSQNKNDEDEQADMTQQEPAAGPNESRFSYKRIIDDVVESIMRGDDKNGIGRKNKKLPKKHGDIKNPFKTQY